MKALTQRDHVTYACDQGVATIVIENGPLNVIDATVKNELSGCLDAIQDDPSIRVVIVTGSGDRAFVAGGDISGISQLFKKGKEELIKAFEDNTFDKLGSLPQPTIAALNGLAYGGGVELALLCDLRIASEDVKLCLPEVNIGLFPAAGGTQRLPRLVGKSKAKEMMLLGEPITAEEALRIGLINRLTLPGQALEKAQEMGRALAKKSGVVLRAIKKVIDEGYDMDLQSALTLEKKQFAEILESTDAYEGIMAFIENRQPYFTHR